MRIVPTIRVLAGTAIALTVAWVAWVANASYGAAARRTAQAELTAVVKDRRSVLQTILEEAQRNARFLAALERMRAAFSDPSATEACALVLTEFAAAHGDVFQARLIDAEGHEVVRVDRGTDDVPRRVPAAELQNKSARDYVIESLALSPGDTYISRIDLNREHGEITVPRQPTIRVASPLSSSFERAPGVVVLNIDLSRVFERIDSDTQGAETFLTDAEGNYLRHPDASRAFAHEFGVAHGLDQDRPELLAQLAATRAHDVAMTVDGHAAALARIDVGDGPIERTFYAGAVRPLSTMPWSDLGLAGIAAALVALLVAVAFGSIVGLRVVAPIEQITAAAKAWERGEDGPTFPVEHSGEVGDLARTFAHLRDAVDARTRALESARDGLESFSRMAAHDLREPAQRVAGYADLLALECEDLGPDARHLASRIVEQGEAILGQVATFAQLSRVHRAGAPASSFTLESVIDGLRTELGTELEKRGATLHCAPAEVAGYERLIKAALGNLVRNALVHSTAAEVEIDVRARVEQETTLLEVVSSGAGLEPDELGDLFLPFVAKGAHAGEGLGLAIVMRTAQYHGGHAEADLVGSSLRVRMLYPTPSVPPSA